MILFLGLVLIGVVAYFLARRDFDRKTIKASRELTGKAKELGGDLQARVKSVSGQAQAKPDAFITWVDGPGESQLPKDFLAWFSSLDQPDQKSFIKSLENYVDSLGMSLPALTSGRLDKQPEFKKVFIETLVVYSDTYRKIAAAKEKPAQASETKTEPQPGEFEAEVKPAEKATSRRG
jgi:hypothetical protein